MKSPLFLSIGLHKFFCGHEKEKVTCHISYSRNMIQLREPTFLFFQMKFFSYSNDIRKDIESHHLEGVSIPCTQQEKTFRSRGSLAMHIKRNHKIQKIKLINFCLEKNALTTHRSRHHKEGQLISIKYVNAHHMVNKGIQQ